MKKFLIVLLLVFSSNLFAQSDFINLNNGNIAISGYDLVSYLEDQKAVEGSKEYRYVYQEVTYQFKTSDHLNKFKKNPKKYIPAYGGWCAYAIGKSGKKVSINPETFKIIDGKTYLFYNKRFTNTLTLWNEDEQSLKQQADQNWDKIISK